MKKINLIKISPHRDWRVIVWIFGVALVIVSAFAWKIYLSDKIGGGYFSPETGTTENQTRVIDTKRLKKAVMISEKRALDSANLKNNLLRPADPSF